MNKKRRRKLRLHKKKITVSASYQKEEAEVSNLLSTKEVSHNPAEKLKQQIEFFTDGFQDCQSGDIQSSPDARSTSTSGHSEASGIQPAASYVQIEEFSPIIPAKLSEMSFTDELLVNHTSKEFADIDDDDDDTTRKLANDGFFVPDMNTIQNRNMTRMVNRFYMEGNSVVISSPSSLKCQFPYVTDNALYKTVCDRTFKPIFYLSSLYEPEEDIMNNKRVVTISIKEIKFCVHPLQTEEHILAQRLEEICKAYSHKKLENTRTKINAELKTVRQIINKLMEEVSQGDNADKIASYSNHAKYLRNQLHKEEQTFKSLIQNSLNTWLALKAIRKKQEFNWTNTKLLIRIEESNIEDEEKLWNERFRTEYNEILREEYEAYYKDKNMKRSKETPQVLPHIRKPDEDRIKENLKQTLINCSKLPGEPNIDFEIGRTRTAIKELDKVKEYYLKISFDGQFVDATKPSKLKSNFVVSINKSYSVCLEKKIPETVKISMYERSIVPPDVKVANLYLPLSSIIRSSSFFDESLEFTSKNNKISGNLKILVHTNRENFISDETIEVEKPRTSQKTKIPKEVIKNWYENQLINPLDPDCSSLMKDLRDEEVSGNIEGTIESEDDSFILNEHLLNFCSEEDIENNMRLKLLKLRYKNDMKYKDYRFVPLFENEFEGECDDKVIDEGDWMDPIDLQKHIGKKYLRKLYDTIVNHCLQLNKNEDASNLLIGNEPPSFTSIISTILSFFGPSRPLNPPKTNQISLKSNNLTEFNIVLNVVRATGVPVRNFDPSAARRNSSVSSSMQGFKYDNVRPYVSVCYKDKSTRTISADGSNPTWNEQLVLQISGNPQEFKDDIKFQLFDEYIEDLISDDSTRGMEVYQRIHANWLGELRIPLSSIFSRQQTEGVFELTSPRILLGYTRPSLDPVDEAISIENVPEIRDSVYLSLYISIEPQFEMRTITTSCLDCSELKEVKVHVQEWCTEVKETVPERFIDPLVSLGSGKRVCVTRLLEPIPLPIDNIEKIEDALRRYVSLFPVLKIMNTCTGLNGVWLNNQLILDTSWASCKDLGVLLACFYLSLGVRAWIVLGIALQYGETVFVLLKYETNYILVDPCTGKKYSSKDVFCPLVQVSYIVGQDNVYCNLQSETRVSMTDFCMEDSGNWMPLFKKSNPAPVGGVHKLNYTFKHPLNTTELRKNIERKIMKKINSWRSTRKTIWNRAFHGILNDILNELEQDVLYGRQPEDILERINRELPTYKVFGFTLNFGYTNLSSISEKVKSTGIHLNTDKNVEFSVAVNIFQYPNNILSVWIFLISAIPFI